MSDMPNDFVEVSRKVADIFCCLDNIESLYKFHHMNDADDRIEQYYEDVIKEINQFDDIEWVENGMTKMVFSFKDIPNYVIKIPFFESYEYEHKNYKNILKYSCEYDGAHVKVMNCDFGNENGNDYCKLEQDLFFATFSYGIDDMFAGTYLSFTVDGKYPVYISKRADDCYYDEIYCDEPYDKEIVNSVEALQQKYYGEYMSFPEELQLKVCADWGPEKLDKLLDFIKTFGISDFHAANFGKNKDGKIILIDYSGFEE